MFLSSFVSSFKEKKRQKEGNTQPCGYQGDRLLCVACECFLFLPSFNKKQERRSKRKHHTNKHSCTSPTLDFVESQAAFVLHCSERAYHSFFTFAPRCLWESRQAWKLEIWAEKWTRNGKLSCSSVTDKKIAWVVFSRQTIDTHTNQHYTHHSTRPNKHIKKRKTQREERRMGNRSTNKQRDSERLSQPTLSSLSSSLPTKNQQTTEKKQPWGVSVLLTACLCPTHLPSRSFSTTWPRSNDKQTGWLSWHLLPS